MLSAARGADTGDPQRHPRRDQRPSQARLGRREPQQPFELLLQERRDLLAKGNKKILLNLAEVNYIDSSGIGELVSAYTTVKNQGGELKLLKLTKKVHDLLQITKLYTVFDVKDDEATAISSFTK